MPLLHRAHFHSPITALAFFSPQTSLPSSPSLYILSGEDTHLHIRSTTTSLLVASIKVFPAQPIHGIFVSDSKDEGGVLIWGGSCVTVLTRGVLDDLLRIELEDESDSERGREREEVKTPGEVDLGILNAPDWIYHGATSPSNPSQAVLVTAHNELLPLHITTRGLTFGKIKAPRTSRPILYSAQVRFTDEDEVLVAAGTVFGEIIVWRCRGLGTTGDSGNGAGVEVLFVLTGHEGSIFGVDISSEILLPGTEEKGNRRRLLASCSDDRTVRIWDITSASTTNEQTVEKEKEKHEHRLMEARETGFGENLPSLEAAAGCVSSKPLAVAMGHVSRIWNVLFAPAVSRASEIGNKENYLTLYSFGEDASAQKWRLDLSGGDSEQQMTLSHQASILRHTGKHIWSSAIFGGLSPSGNKEKRTLIATGGGDGKINLVEDVEGGYPGSIMATVSGSEVCARFLPSMTSPPLPDKIGIQQQENHESGEQGQGQGQKQATSSPKRTKRAKTNNHSKEDEPFQMYAILSATSFLATTPTGRIFKGSLWSFRSPGNAQAASNDGDIQWAEIPLPQAICDDLRQYQIVRGLQSETKGTVLLASKTGKLYLYSDQDMSIRQIYQMPGKIADVFPLPPSAVDDILGDIPRSLSTTTVPIIVTTMGNPQPMRLLLLGLGEGATATVLQEHTIELSKGFIVTSAGCCQGHLIFGSRNGALAVYQASTANIDGDEKRTTRFEQITRLDRPHTKDAVSTIIPLPPKKPTTTSSPPLDSTPACSCPYFLTTSRDGRYRIYELTTPATKPSFSSTPDPIDMQVRLRHEAVPPFGPFIEGAFFTTGSTNQPELILSGFRSQDFIVWNETRQMEMAKVECGGAYRSFTYHVDGERSRDVTFVWTRASKTCVYSYISSEQEKERNEEGQRISRTISPSANAAGITTLNPSGHGREIKAAASWGSLLATGAEDTTLRIWRVTPATNDPSCLSNLNSPAPAPYPPSPSVMECLAVVEKHTTGIQHLKWICPQYDHHTRSNHKEQPLYLISSSGNEELFLWRVSDFFSGGGSAYEGLAVVCEGVWDDKTKDGDLRVMGFDAVVLRHEPWDERDEEQQDLLLTLVLSNSTLRTYRYSTTLHTFSPLAEGRYTGACLTHVQHLYVSPTATSSPTSLTTGISDFEIDVLTTSTDGHIALWKTTTSITLSSSSPPLPPPPPPPPPTVNNRNGEREEAAEENGRRSKYTLLSTSRLHQSSIKSLNLTLLRPSSSSPTSSSSTIPSLPSYLLTTGGDDNALGITCLNPSISKSGFPTYTISSRTLLPSAHAAAITGLVTSSFPLPTLPISPTETQTTVRVITTSTDQRVKLWDIHLTSNHNHSDEDDDNASASSDMEVCHRVQKVSLLSNRYSGVADCGDLVLLDNANDNDGDGKNNPRVVVAGVGMEIWMFERCT